MGLFLGLLLGARHALEPDHLAAVSCFATSQGRPVARAGVWLGAAWGIGHTTALFVVGCVLAALERSLPARVASGFELLVAVMLVALGAAAVRRALAGTAPDTCARPAWRLVRRPLLTGIVHGLAGSGALTALALASVPTTGGRLAYIGLFGLGSVVAMSGLAGLAGWSLTRVGDRGQWLRGLALATGTASLVLGLAWGWSAVAGLVRA